jgi:hypothetical protein
MFSWSHLDAGSVLFFNDVTIRTLQKCDDEQIDDEGDNDDGLDEKVDNPHQRTALLFGHGTNLRLEK